jgi:hypothetical protein
LLDVEGFGDDVEETVDAIAGRYRAAYFDHVDSPRRGTHRPSTHR